jgi:DNA polymerase III sliding clamp (beta) subunit (PCNA family)
VKAYVLSDKFQKALKLGALAVETKPRLPVLSTVHLKAEDARLRLGTTDLDVSIVSYIGSKVEREGAICIPQKVLQKIAEAAPGSRLDLDVVSGSLDLHLRVAATEAEYTLKGISPSEFPIRKDYVDQHDFVVDTPRLKGALEYVIPVSGTNRDKENNYGIDLRFGVDEMVAYAADGSRMATYPLTYYSTADDVAPRNFSLNLDAAKTLLKFVTAHNGAKDGEYTCGVSFEGDDIIRFQFRHTHLMARKAKVAMRDYAASVSAYSQDLMNMNAADLLGALKAAEIFAIGDTHAIYLESRFESPVLLHASTAENGRFRQALGDSLRTGRYGIDLTFLREAVKKNIDEKGYVHVCYHESNKMLSVGSMGRAQYHLMGLKTEESKVDWEY